MMYSDTNPEHYRKQFIDAYLKAQNKMPMTPLEQQIAQVVIDHPEYHKDFLSPDILHAEFLPEHNQSNPFLHLSLHLAIRDQIQTNRPFGIQALFKKHVEKSQDALETEHVFMDCLAQALWESSRQQCPPNETDYLEKLKYCCDK